MFPIPPKSCGNRGLLLRTCAGFLLCTILVGGAYYTKTVQAKAETNAIQKNWDVNIGLGNVDLFALINTNKGKAYTLSTYDRGLYQSIFTAQQAGDWSRANALIKRIHDNSLMGHVLYDRYINSRDYKASYPELRHWMVKYGDHPNAYKVYQLAQKRRNNDPAQLPAPQMAKKLFGSLEFAWLNKEAKESANAYKPAQRNEASVRDLMRRINGLLARDSVTQAYDTLGKSPASKMLTNIEYDSLLSKIASGYFYNNKFDEAYNLSAQAIRRSKKSVPYAEWIAGLSSWQKHRYSVSAKHFEAIIESHTRNPWMLSAAAFWAARAHEKLGDNDASDDWLHEAASYPRTFYGLIAREKIGDSMSFSWDTPELSKTLVNTLRDIPAGQRALALVDVGQNELAAHELEQIHPNGNKRIEKALIAASYEFHMPDLALRLGNAVNQDDGKLYDAALYPVVPWKGDVNANVEPALINALIRQESKFNVAAQNSRSGARGLMQLMPRTAQFVSDKSYNARDIHKPDVNIALGQRYVRHLLELPQVNGNLLFLAAAYNAGPTNLARWQKKISYKDDPFLFIESIPLSETRAFVEKVMTNYWIYSQRLTEDSATLESISGDEWPIYNASKENILKLAAY